MKKYKVAVVIGRFQPIHNGHLELIDSAYKLADNVICLVGSSYSSRTIKNPFSFEERSKLILSLYKEIIPVPIRDFLYDDSAWASSVNKNIRFVAEEVFNTIESKDIVIVGHKKDKSSYYLNMFPQFDYHEVDKTSFINATDIREYWYKEQFDLIEGLVPEETLDFLESYPTVEYYNLIDEYFFIEKYKIRWEIAPYPVIFQTVDAVVMRSNHVLLIQRRSSPGKGLWALPGGFLNYSEKTLDGCLRELREETKLDLPEKVLLGSLKGQKRFDHPDRSLRGRTITEAFYFELPNGKLDKVKGSDDAVKAKWVHINDIKSEEMFEDHYHIIQYFTGIGK